MDGRGNPKGEPVSAKAGEIIEMTEEMAKPVVAQGRLEEAGEEPLVEETPAEDSPVEEPKEED